MLEILKKEILWCHVCSEEFSDENKPFIASCGNTFCSKCFPEFKKGIPCFYGHDHNHLGEKERINYSFLSIIEDLKKIKDNNQSISKENLQLPNNNLEEKFTGNYVNGQKHGIGEYTAKDIIFNGNFQNDKPKGPGKLIYHNKGIFEGQFEGSFDKGKGTIIYPNGDVYTGEWKDFKKIGNGILEMSNGNRYKGDFKDDKFNGIGELYSNEEHKTTKGTWKNGVEEGTVYIFTKKSLFPLRAKFSKGKLVTIEDLQYKDQIIYDKVES